MEDFRERITALSQEVEDALKHFGLSDKKQELEALELQMNEESFWNDTNFAQKISKKAGNLRSGIENWENLREKAESLKEWSAILDEENADREELEGQLLKDLEELEKMFAAASMELYMSGQFDANTAILNFHAGTGGTDAQDFAEMLMRMYLRFCERRNWKTQAIHQTPGSEAGIKSASFKVEGPYAYGYLKHENGVHRLVRLSPFNSGSTRETSFAMVEVTPEIEEDELEIKDEDIKWDVFRSGGAGGQSVNTTDSAVRLTHLPSGIVITCQNERSQLQNKESAMRSLKGKLVALQEQHHLDTIRDIRGEHTSHSWGNQIRSYVLHPYQMVKDHRTEYETSQVDKVLEGDLDGFIEAGLKSNKL